MASPQLDDGGIDFEYSDFDTMADVLDRAVEINGEDAVLRFLESTRAALEDGEAVAVPGLQDTDPSVAVARVDQMLAEHVQGEGFQETVATQVPSVTPQSSASSMPIYGGAINDKRTWQTVIYFYRTHCNLLVFCEELDRVRTRLNIDPAALNYRISVNSVYEKNGGRIKSISFQGRIHNNSTGAAIASGLKHTLNPSTKAVFWYNDHPSQKGKSFFFSISYSVKSDIGNYSDSYRTAKASCNSSATPTCKW
jgi:hypothetical protein